MCIRKLRHLVSRELLLQTPSRWVPAAGPAPLCLFSCFSGQLGGTPSQTHTAELGSKGLQPHFAPYSGYQGCS